MDGSYEVAIVGGGPAGLSAALVLGRCRRRVVLFDHGHHRNDAALRMHGYLTRDGIAPAELRRLGAAEIAQYPTVELRRAEVVDARRADHGFAVRTADGTELSCRLLLLATGVVDELPAVTGAAALLGDRLFHCPYCDAWELRDQPLAVLAQPDDRGARFALVLSQWSRDLVMYLPQPRLSDAMAARVAARGIEIDPRQPVALARDGDGLRIQFAGGDSTWRRALFFHLGARQRSDLARRLGCTLDANGGVVVDNKCVTGQRGVYVAGDSSRDTLQAIVAAGEGAAAAVAMNLALAEMDAGLARPG